jgi:heme-degrading monooxygenase HmoA
LILGTNRHNALTEHKVARITQEQFKSRSVYQLRIYEVSPDKKAIFHNRFKNHALPIMKRYGFEVVALWESSTVANFEFIYLLKWPDAASMERQWELFLADEEWIAIKKKTVSETGEPVLKATGRLLNDVEYFPPFEG